MNTKTRIRDNPITIYPRTRKRPAETKAKKTLCAGGSERSEITDRRLNHEGSNKPAKITKKKKGQRREKKKTWRINVGKQLNKVWRVINVGFVALDFAPLFTRYLLVSSGFLGHCLLLLPANLENDRPSMGTC